MSVIAIDPGRARHGVAVSGPLGISIKPLAPVRARDEAAAVKAIASIAEEREAELIVVGLPVNMDGSEGFSTRWSRKLGTALAKATGIEIVYWDERLTTEEAARYLRESGLSGSKRRKMIDSQSAIVILRSYLDAKGGADDTPR